MRESEKLKKGLPYHFLDPEVVALKRRAAQLCFQFNQLAPTAVAQQNEIIQQLLGSVGENISLQADFHCDNGQNIHVGCDFLTNYNVTILDILPVTIGDYCMIGPNTLITTVGHPLDRSERRERMAKAKAIKIGDDVWIGGNCTILPGVKIGNNVVVAAGAVVTKNIPSNSVVAGVPAKVVKKISA